MKKIFTILLIITCSFCYAQDSLKTFNMVRIHTTQTGMEVLGSWGIANTAAGAIGWASSNGGSNKYFYQMTTIWGVVNFGIAALGYFGTQKDKGKTLNAAETLQAQKAIERTFLINGGLDLVYIGAGVYIKHRGNERTSDQLKGYGSSVIMQGVFLLLFDATMYNAERSNGTKLCNFLVKNPITFDGKRLGMIIHL